MITLEEVAVLLAIKEKQVIYLSQLLEQKDAEIKILKEQLELRQKEGKMK